MDVRAVAFDIGNTLIDDRTIQALSIKQLARELSDAGAIGSQDEFVTTFVAHNRANTIPFLSHTFGDVRFFEDTFRSLGITTVEPSDALAWYRNHVVAQFQIDDEVVAALKVLRDSGLKTGVISNETVERVSVLFSKTGLGGLFDSVVISEAIGIEKPDLMIFQEGCRQLGVRCEETIYLGDNEIADGACKELGMLFVLVEGYKHADWGWERGKAYAPDYIVDKVACSSVQEVLRYARGVNTRRNE